MAIPTTTKQSTPATTQKTSLFSAVKGAVQNIGQSIQNTFNVLKGAIQSGVSKAVEVVKGGVSKAGEVITGIFTPKTGSAVDLSPGRMGPQPTPTFEQLTKQRDISGLATSLGKAQEAVSEFVKTGTSGAAPSFASPERAKEIITRHFEEMGIKTSGFTPMTTGTAPTPTGTGKTYIEKEVPPVARFQIAPDTTELENLIRQNLPQIPSNVPEGAEGYVFRDPLGGSSYVFDYYIKPGDTLEKIASNFRVSKEELLKLNQDKKSVKGALIEREALRIPVKYQEPEFNEIIQQAIQSGYSIEQINRLQSQLYDYWIAKKTPAGVADNVTYGLFQNEINRLYDLLDTYIQRTSAESYRDTYQKLLDEQGITADYQRLFDNVLKEAAAAGGIVTQSQVEAVVKFRQGILKQEAETLSEIIDMKERMIDKTMKYIEMDREELNRRLDKALGIQDKIANLQLKAAKWQYDYTQDLIDKNQKKLEGYVKAGLLHTFSPSYLATFANPYHLNYAGYTASDIALFYRLSAETEKEKKIKQNQIALNIQKTIQEMEYKKLKIEKLKGEIEEEEEFDIGSFKTVSRSK